MVLTFLGTGGAWGLPELNCRCMTCRAMEQKGESRTRTSFLLENQTNLLIDCGPDIAAQLSRRQVGHLDALLITHEHGDHYMGMDELFSYKRSSPKGKFQPIPVYLTGKSWETVTARFNYLVEMDVIRIHTVESGKTYRSHEFEFTPFKTNHGAFASGSVGYIVSYRDKSGGKVRLVYTSDFVDLPEFPSDLFEPDYLIIQSFWFHEPTKNIPNHMSFQRALLFIKQWQPKKETFLVHIGDGDAIPGDPANDMLKKREALDPLRAPLNGDPYPVPRTQGEWQGIVDRVKADFNIPVKITVARDDMVIQL